MITDVSLDEKQTGIAVYHKSDDSFRLLFRPRFEGVFHGTGDVFASFLLSALLGGQKLMDAAAPRPGLHARQHPPNDGRRRTPALWRAV